MNWLEVSDAEVEVVNDAPPSSGSGRKKPPRLPGASFTLPPMPVITKSTPPPGAAGPEPRRNTVEVEMQWVELIDDDKGKTVETKPRKSKRPIPREED